MSVFPILLKVCPLLKYSRETSEIHFWLTFLVIFLLYSISFPSRNTSINKLNSRCTDTHLYKMEQ